MSGAEPDDDAVPRLGRGVRLKEDGTRGGHVLLAPERVVSANASAVAVLERCDGIRTVSAIVDDLASVFAADRALLSADVRRLLAELGAKRLVRW